MKLVQWMETVLFGTLIIGLSADTHIHQNAYIMPSNTLVSDVISPYYAMVDEDIPFPTYQEDSGEALAAPEPLLPDAEVDLAARRAAYTYGEPVPEYPFLSTEYFSKTAVIGDSRGKGLMLFGSMAGVDLTAEALSVYNLWEKTFSTPYGTMTAIHALANDKFNRVYINLGINAVGYPSRDKFYTLYGNLVDEIRRTQPNAQIYVQSIIPVNETILHRNGTGSYINNEVIQEFNGMLSDLCAEKHLHYLDLYNFFVDETGQLPEAASNDGLHFGAEYSKLWANYLYTHVVQ